MHYYVPCDCGSQLPVEARQAGMQVACRCGRTVAVPLLSQLRRQAGQEAYALNAVERLQRLLSTSGPPTNGQCLVCQRTTSHIEACQAVCERVWVRRGLRGVNLVFWILGVMISPMLALWSLMKHADHEGPAEELGRDVVVSLPFHLCEGCQERNVLRGQRQLRQALEQIPAYAELLREYPEAELSRG